MSAALTIHEVAQDRPKSAVMMLAQRTAIVDCMRAAMVKDVDYGTVPGTNKPSLYKPGSEKLLSMFHLATKPEVEDLSTPDTIRYRVTLNVTEAGTGRFLGAGVGEASSAETKYQWRAAVCDAEWDETTIDRRRTKWSKGGWKNGTQSPPYTTKQVRAEMEDVANCVTPDTLILTHDLRWVPAGELKTGDMLMGVEENRSTAYRRNLAVGEATVYGRRTDEILEIEFADGRSVRCNGEHKWLVKKVGLKGTEWVSTREIFEHVGRRKGRPRKWTVLSLCKPWEEDCSRQGGYLAGLLDADGTLGLTQVLVRFAQQQNGVLDSMRDGLTNRGFLLSTTQCKSQASLAKTIHGKQVFNLTVLGDLSEHMRLLGMLRPPRLLGRWLSVDLSKRRLEDRACKSTKSTAIVSVSAVGPGEIVMLGTSCKTYIANGLVCHNTVLKMAKKRAQIDAVLTVTAASDVFSQDLEDLPTDFAPETLAENPDAESAGQTGNQPLPTQLPRRNPPPQQQRPAAGGPVISEAQSKRAYAIRKGQNRISDDEVKHKLMEKIGMPDDRQMPAVHYNAYVAWLQGGSW